MNRLNPILLEKAKASGRLRVGLASKSIAPTWPVVLPYGKQTPTMSFYSKSIYCKVLILEVENLKIGLAALDVIGFRRKWADLIKRRVEEGTGFPASRIMLAATHNHSYPRLSDEKVLNFVADRTAEAFREALDSMFEAGIGFSSRRLPRWVNVNRRKVDGPIDTTLLVCKLVEQGAVRGVVFTFPSHPNIYTTAWGGRTQGKIGPEWPGYARLLVEAGVNVEQLRTLYPDVEYRDVFSMFLLDACGDLQPYTGRGRWFFVKKVSRAVLKTLNGSKPVEKVELGFKRAVIQIPVKERYRRWLGSEYPVGFQIITINDCCMVAVPCEVTCELGLRFKRSSGFKHSTLITCANDALGYFVSEAEGLENVGYEAQGSPLSPSRGRVLLDAILSILNPLHKPQASVDVGRGMGWVEGMLEYEGLGEVCVGLKRECNPPAYGEPPVAPFLGLRFKPDVEGLFRFKPLMPGLAFIYVDEKLNNRPIPIMWGEPVRVKAGRGVKVKVRLPDRIVERVLKARSASIEILEASTSGLTVSGRVSVQGWSCEEPVNVWAYRLGDALRHHKHYLRRPIAKTVADAGGRFKLRFRRPGSYGFIAWIDVNMNGRPEPGVDIVSRLRRSVVGPRVS